MQEIEYIEVIPQLKKEIAEKAANVAESSGVRRGRSREIKNLHEKLLTWLDVGVIISTAQWEAVKARVEWLAEPSRDMEQVERDLLQLVLYMHSCRH